MSNLFIKACEIQPLDYVFTGGKDDTIRPFKVVKSGFKVTLWQHEEKMDQSYIFHCEDMVSVLRYRISN